MYKQIAMKAATSVTEPLIQSDEASVKETSQRDPCETSVFSSPKTAACSGVQKGEGERGRQAEGKDSWWSSAHAVSATMG